MLYEISILRGSHAAIKRLAASDCYLLGVQNDTDPCITGILGYLCSNQIVQYGIQNMLTFYIALATRIRADTCLGNSLFETAKSNLLDMSAESGQGTCSSLAWATRLLKSPKPTTCNNNNIILNAFYGATSHFVDRGALQCNCSTHFYIPAHVQVSGHFTLYRPSNGYLIFCHGLITGGNWGA